MPVNPDYDREFSFDINSYLVENYPVMNMATRRSICSLSLEWLDTDDLENVVDEVVSHYAKDQLKLLKKEQEDDS
tara:strand:- start:2858 stop:3082 length:225 start_codon:yes stop_codon:yes gene_type:complete